MTHPLKNAIAHCYGSTAVACLDYDGSAPLTLSGQTLSLNDSSQF
ncbi:hypothetical protein [Synechococcus elongatus]